MLYALLLELKDEITPLFILPIIEERIADGSIITEYPKELSETANFVERTLVSCSMVLSCEA